MTCDRVCCVQWTIDHAGTKNKKKGEISRSCSGQKEGNAEVCNANDDDDVYKEA